MHKIDSTLLTAGCPRLPLCYDEIERWLCASFARLAECDVADIDVERAFVDYQLDSSVAVTLAEQLGRFGEVQLQATIFWEYPNIRALASALAIDGEELRS